MSEPFEYVGRPDTCMGCGTLIHPGHLVAPVTADRDDRLLCAACYWLEACGLPLPAWSPRPAA